MSPTNPFEALRDNFDEAKRVADTIFDTLKADEPDAVPFPIAAAGMMLALAELILANTTPPPIWARMIADQIVQMVNFPMKPKRTHQ
jgi:hypothetical protein